MKYLMLASTALTFAAVGSQFERIVSIVHPTGNPSAASIPLVERPMSIKSLGYVEPLTGTRHLSFATGGLIKACYCEIGEWVKEGQPLLELCSEQQRAQLLVSQQLLKTAEAERDHLLGGIHPEQVNMARCDLKATRLRLAFLEHELKRSLTLLESNAISQRKFKKDDLEAREHRVNLDRAGAHLRFLETNVTDQESALATQRVELAKATVSRVQTKLALCSLNAPFGGRVLDILRREGEAVDEVSKPPVIVLGDVQKYRIRAEVDEQHVAQLREGLKAVVTGRNLHGARYEGRVVLVKPRMGKKRVLSENAEERHSLHVAEVFIEMEDDFRGVVGLMVEVSIVIGNGKDRTGNLPRRVERNLEIAK